LASSSGRIVGHHRLLGRVIPTLKKIGRVPFGQFKRGKASCALGPPCERSPAAPGTYLITPHLVTRKGIVTEFGKPPVLHIR
jgi:hypothetical protein